MRRLAILVTSVAIFLVSVGVTKAQSVQQEYQSAMVTYRQYQAQFDRDRQLYQLGSGTSFETVIVSANQAFAARQLAAYRYTQYLQALVQTYVTDPEIQADLVTKLQAHAEAIAGMTVSFQTMSQWAQADNEATSILAGLNETAYQSFAQIYYLELSNIIDAYVALYQGQNQRILAEAKSEIDRQNKAKILDETERTLINLQAQIAAARPNLNFVNSLTAYTSLRDKLDDILALAETSLKNYASLE